MIMPIIDTGSIKGVKTKNTAGISLNLCYYTFHYGKYQKFGKPDYKPPRTRPRKIWGKMRKLVKFGVFW